MRTTHLATLFGMLGCRHRQERYGGGRQRKGPCFYLLPLDRSDRSVRLHLQFRSVQQQIRARPDPLP